MILLKNLQQYHHYHHVKLLNVNILQVKNILPFYYSRIIAQPKFTYSPLGEALEKQIKAIEDQRKKQVEVLKVLQPEESQQPKVI